MMQTSWNTCRATQKIEMPSFIFSNIDIRIAIAIHDRNRCVASGGKKVDSQRFVVIALVDSVLKNEIFVTCGWYLFVSGVRERKIAWIG